MAQQVTLKEITMAVRELTFDRFVVPAFVLKEQGPGIFLSIDKEYSVGLNPEDLKGRFIIYQVTASEPKNIVELLFKDYPTLEDLLNKLIDEGIVLAYTPYFRSLEPTTSLLKVTERELTEDITLFRRYFFSDEEIFETIKDYYLQVLDIPNVVLSEETIGKLCRPSEKHMTIWVSYMLVDKRRLYENAANYIGQQYTDGSDYAGSISTTTPTSTNVTIGSVFSITEDTSQGFFYEDFNRVGSDNTWGDRHSFWYKLMLYLRGLLEQQFMDYRLRQNNVIQGQVSLVRDLDFRSYYDSYPFTLSPLSRGILSKTP